MTNVVGLLLINWIVHVLSTSRLTPNCVTVEKQTIVPGLTPSQDSSEDYTFEFELERMSHVLQLYQWINFSAIPENVDFIKTNNWRHCFKLGKPIAWDNFKTVKETLPASGKFIMDGLLGVAEAAADGSAQSMEACMFEDMVFYGERQCSGKIKTLSDELGVEKTNYGNIKNTIMLPIVFSAYTQYLNTDTADSESNNNNLICRSTPLTDMLLNFKNVVNDMFCALDHLMQLIHPIKGIHQCHGIRYRLARLKLKSDDNWEDNLAATCATLPQFICNSSNSLNKRAAPLGSKLRNKIGKEGSRFVERVVTKLMDRLMSPEQKVDVNKHLSDEVYFVRELNTAEVFLSMRIENKFSMFKINSELFTTRLLGWFRMLELETRLALRSFHDKYLTILSKLTSNRMSCSLSDDGLSFSCSRNALLQKTTWSSVSLETESIGFKLGNVFYVNCLQQNGINFVGNQMVFISDQGYYKNENLSVPINCLNRDTYTDDKCQQYFSDNFTPNYKISEGIEAIAVNDKTIQIASDMDFTVSSADNEIVYSGKLFEIGRKHFPIIVSGPEGSAQISISELLNKIAKVKIQNQIMRAMPKLREFVISTSQGQKPMNSYWKPQNPYDYISASTGILAGGWLLLRVLKFCSKVSVKQVLKYKGCMRTPDEPSMEQDNDCHMPLIHRNKQFDRREYREQLKKYVMGEFGNQQNDPTTKGEIDPSEGFGKSF